ncbi:MAG: hypothetical protein H0W83_06885 [Planctomycetes bacterium]|nr:hypothetical protein [Planctomycetota bacterium]
MTDKRIVNIQTDRNARGPFDDAMAVPIIADDAAPADPEIIDSALSDDGATLLSDLRNLCEEALLKPMDCPGKRPLRALERRDDPKGQVYARPKRDTTNRIADEMTGMLKRTPRLRSLLAERLKSEAGGSASERPMSGAESRSLREVMDFLDRLGCPRGDDDHNFTPVERVRWLLDVMSASQGARATFFPPGGEATPATGQQFVVREPATSDPPEDAAP